MKPLQMFLFGESNHAILNVGFRQNGCGIELFPRYVPFAEGKNVPGEQSYIGFCSQNKDYHPYCIVPSGSVVGYEDAACIFGEMIVCNKTVRAIDPLTGEATLKPIPSLFHVDWRGRASQVGELEGKLADLYCKGLTLLDRDFVLIRPIFDQSDGVFWTDPRILLCRLKNGFDLNLSPERVFLRARPKEGIGISAPPVNTPHGLILVYHRIVWNEEKTARQYLHYPLLMDNRYPWEIQALSDTPIISCQIFPPLSKCWIGGATYFRNLVYDPCRKSLNTIVTEGDINNFWLEIPLSSIVSRMRKAYNRCRTISPAFF